MSKLIQSIKSSVNLEYYIAASAAVSAVRTARRNEKLTSEAYMAIAALPDLIKIVALSANIYYTSFLWYLSCIGI